MQLSLGVEAVLVVRHTCEIIVPRHLLHDIDGQHLQGVCVEVQRAENLFKREGALGIVGEKLDQPFRQFLFGEALASFLSFSHNENILCGVHVGVWGARVVNIGKQKTFLMQINKIFLTIPRPPPYFLLKQEKHNIIKQQKANG